MSNLSCGTHVAEPSANKDCRKLLNQFCRFLPKLKLPISADAKLPLTCRRFHPGRQAATSYGQEPIRNLCPGVLPLPPEVLVLWNAFLFQQGLDCCPFLPGLAWISSICSRVSMSVSISGAKLYTS